MKKLWRDCQPHCPEGFDKVGWFLLCLIFAEILNVNLVPRTR